MQKPTTVINQIIITHCPVCDYAFERNPNDWASCPHCEEELEPLEDTDPEDATA